MQNENIKKIIRDTSVKCAIEMITLNDVGLLDKWVDMTNEIAKESVVSINGELKTTIAPIWMKLQLMSRSRSFISVWSCVLNPFTYTYTPNQKTMIFAVMTAFYTWKVGRYVDYILVNNHNDNIGFETTEQLVNNICSFPHVNEIKEFFDDVPLTRLGNRTRIE